MSTKRAHSKSRTGCKQCKARRIKCDETPPCCHNCAKKGLPCEYQDFRDAFENIRLLTPETYAQSSNSSQSRILKSSSPTSANSDPSSSPKPAVGAGFSIADLGYMHWYSTQTCHALCVLPDDQHLNIWQYQVPELAAACPSLMHALLGVAAAHQHSQLIEKQADPANLRAIRTHYSKALCGFLDNENGSMVAWSGDQLMCFSLLVAQLTMYLERQKSAAEGGTPVSVLISVINVLQASRAVLELPHIQHGPVSSVLFEHIWNPSSQAADFGVSMALDQLAATVNRWASQPGASQDEYRACVQAVEQLRQYYAMVSTRPSTWRYIFRFLAGLGPEFCTMLQHHHPIALCITAHWAVAIYNAPERWYSASWPGALMSTLSHQLEASEWRDGIMWPLQQTIYQGFP